MATLSANKLILNNANVGTRRTVYLLSKDVWPSSLARNSLAQCLRRSDTSQHVSQVQSRARTSDRARPPGASRTASHQLTRPTSGPLPREFRQALSLHVCSLQRFSAYWWAQKMRERRWWNENSRARLIQFMHYLFIFFCFCIFTILATFPFSYVRRGTSARAFFECFCSFV